MFLTTRKILTSFLFDLIASIVERTIRTSYHYSQDDKNETEKKSLDKKLKNKIQQSLNLSENSDNDSEVMEETVSNVII